MAKLRADTKHVQNIQDFWGDPLTAAGAQSADGKAAYVQLYLAGNQGETLANESVQAVRDIVANSPPPPGLKVFVTGPGAMMADQQVAGDKGVHKITAVTLVVIVSMLLWIYRSPITVVLALVMVGVQVGAARGVVAFLSMNDLIGLSTFAVNLLTTLGIAAGAMLVSLLVGLGLMAGRRAPWLAVRIWRSLRNFLRFRFGTKRTDRKSVV
jgi:RND superfamily putative drug exporter